MLTREALNASLPLTEKLDSLNLYLVPVVGTPLEALVNATRSDSNFVVRTDGGDCAPDIDSIEYIANCKDDATGASCHDAAMDDIVEVATKAVQGHITFAKTVVAPAVQDLVEKTAQSLNELTPSVLLGMEVVQYGLPSPLANSALESSVRRFAETPFDVPKLVMKSPDLGLADIKALFNSGSAGLDRDIEEWLAGKGDSFVQAVWSSVFQVKQYDSIDAPAKTFRDYIEDRVDGVDWALAIFLISRKLVDAPIEGIEMNLDLFESTAVEFRNQAGARLVRALDEDAQVAKSGVLVRSHTDRVTVVNASVYRSWIEAGGENEVLFGNLLTQPAHYTVDQINANAAGLKADWNRHAALTATVESNRKFDRTKSVMERHFTSQLAAITGDDIAVLGNAEGVLKAFRDQLELVNEDDVSDLYALALRLVCRSRFAHTDAERILAGIERIKRENPTVDVREAAAVSVIEYVAHWVGTQFKVQSR